MKIKKLTKDIPLLEIKGSKEVEITGVCSNSQVLAPGNLFVAKKGRNFDGSCYIPEAIAAGAAAILTDIYDPSLKQVVQLIHPDIDMVEGTLAARFYDYPSDRLFMIGITGTNGKTTTATLVKHILDTADTPCGLIGTIEYIIGPYRHQASRTTPDLCSNQKMLSEMLREKCQAAVMEVTSHALDQGRVDNINFDVAVYTNLTPEHLDYHHTMEQYAQAKRRLFTTQGGAEHRTPRRFAQEQSNILALPNGKTPVAIVNKDCPWHSKVIEGCQAKIITYGLTDADLTPKNVELSADGSRFSLEYQSEKANFHVPLAGRFNLYNALAAIGVGLVRGIPIQALANSVANFQSVPGRLELIPNNLGISIYVDYAHKSDALENTLSTLYEVKKERIITIFGCGGDRDRGKRPKMAQVSEKWSDLTIVTSDNPRSEKPEDICTEIIQGFSNPDKYIIELDRKAAIEKAIAMAKPDDIILIAGKGHEKQQIFAHQTIAFSDSAIARELCDQRSE